MEVRSCGVVEVPGAGVEVWRSGVDEELSVEWWSW